MGAGAAFMRTLKVRIGVPVELCIERTGRTTY